MSILDGFRIDGQIAVVTGAGKGIGRAIAIALAEAGADVALGARTAADIEAVAEEIRARGRRALAVPTDATSMAALENLASRAAEELGPVSIWVSNAGGIPDGNPRYLTKTTEASWDAQVDLNLKAVWMGAVVAAKAMGEAGGVILNTSSRAAFGPQVKNGPYAAAKAGVNSLTQTLSRELAPKIRVNAVAPGPIPTENFNDCMRTDDEAKREALREMIGIPLQRFGREEDIAAAALYFVSPASGWVTGQCLYVAGGCEVSEQTDVLIIGAGAAGMAAALSAHAAGAEVVLVEKGERLGGTAAVSGGIIWAANNPRMQAAGMADSEADALAYFGSLDHGEMEPEVLGAFVREAPGALAFLEEAGALAVSILPGYPDYYLDRPGAKPEGGRALDNELFDFTTLGPWTEKVFSDGVIQRMMLRETPLGGSSGYVDPAELKRRADADLRGFGQAMVGRLLAACLARGIEPQLGMKADRLIVEEGRVVGVAFAGGRSIHAARGVILATGGFEWNEALKKTFLRGPLDMPASPPGNTGDGLKLAMSVGAGLGNMTSAWWVPTLSIGGAHWAGGEQRASPVLIERTLPHSLLVNRAGKRFCNEAINYSSLAGAFHLFDPATYDYPNNPAWLVFDAQYRARYPIGPVMPFDALPDWVFSSDTLEELAAKIDVDAAAMLQTVERFNAHAANAQDPDFGRGVSTYDHFYGDRSRPGAAATLGPLSQGPFHAVQLKLGALGTNGGARTNAAAQVLDVEGEPIPGLYGAGNVIACPTGSVYAGAGGTLGPALTFGCIAGRTAARLANQ